MKNIVQAFGVFKSESNDGKQRRTWSSRYKLNVVLPILLLLAQSACSVSSDTVSGLVGQSGPDTRFTRLDDGSYHPFAEFAGSPLVVIFWAEWCAFSRPAIETLNELAAEEQFKNVAFLAVSIDEYNRYERVQERVNHGKLSSITHAFSGNGTFDEAYTAYRASDLPHIFVIAPDGKVVAEGHGAGFVEDALEDLLVP